MSRPLPYASRRAIGALLVLAIGLAGPAIAAAPPPLIPVPASLQPGQGQFQLRDGTTLQSRGEGADAAADYLVRMLQRTGGPTLARGTVAGADITIEVDPRGFAADASQEAYRLDVSARGIRIGAPHARGLFYGAVTLWQLATAGEGEGTVRIPALRIDDAPRFAWRGYMLDSARHFESVEQIERLLDAMAIHKLNVFHWHLTDDQGWRLEIKAYPKLAQVGGCRAQTDGDGVPYCGFYSQEQVRHIVRYAAERQITVVPEIDVPGHATAAIAAYPELGVTGRAMPVSNERGIHANLFNVEESTFRFLDTVLGEVADLFPGAYVHVGGDEAIKEQWNASARVQARMRELGLGDADQLQSYFMGRMQASLDRRGKRLIGWDEILDGGLPPRAAVMSWRGVEGGVEAARLGHDVVMSPTRSLYLDYLQTRSPNEPHGRLALIPLDRFYAFEPVPEQLPAAQHHHILGLQANMWTGDSATFATIQHNTFPRLAAMAETGWSPRARKDYAGFLQRLPAQLQRYRRLGIAYAQTPFEVLADAEPGDAAGTARVRLDTPLDYEIRYSLDGGAPSSASPRYTGPLQLRLPAQLRAATFHDGRALGPVAAFALDPASLLRREEAAMDECPAANGPALRLAGSAGTDGRRPLFNVDIMTPCWLWKNAPTAGIGAVRVHAARLPYTFRLSPEEEKRRRFLPAASANGELDIRAGGCDGPVVASVPMPAATPADGTIQVQAPLAATDGRQDLCIRFSGDTRPAIWALDRVELLPR
ncbi:family 20 glycosylhydrolase [Stenotrophomonas sp. MMGLT7]|uniref:family 20 glycosylhydrolase n=1 Tax=Stenotrophomonas sp. MMGLT7 TaxID=2901227 RepID=UPI001E3F4574|nr:family 20 glycosylhydrolase [Stenotrophomonas sp. MMGLT7]MCD7099967.1 family 20 glycosylhydrolase [Stenotrophomonas sp. MMGLT7]